MDGEERHVGKTPTEAVIMKLNEQDENIEQILESAVVVNWADLIHSGQSGLIHIEYGFAPSGTLDYLKVWSSIARLLASVFGFWSSSLCHVFEPS
jgi:hypothetical protein